MAELQGENRLKTVIWRTCAGGATVCSSLPPLTHPIAPYVPPEPRGFCPEVFNHYGKSWYRNQAGTVGYYMNYADDPVWSGSPLTLRQWCILFLENEGSRADLQKELDEERERRKEDSNCLLPATIYLVRGIASGCAFSADRYRMDMCSCCEHVYVGKSQVRGRR